MRFRKPVEDALKPFSATACHRFFHRFLAEGDANTCFFHLQACHRRRKNQLPSLSHNGLTFTAEEAKADLVYSYYDSLGKNLARLHRIDLERLPLPSLDLSDQAVPFTEAELNNIVKETHSNRAPGPDGFTRAFFKAAWDTVKSDIMDVFQAMWALDSRSFYLLNGAIMVLLRKKEVASGLKDYHPISLIHSVGKLFSKGLALRLAPRMKEIIKDNQTAFIKGRRIHENFRAVQLTCRWLHATHCPSMLLKINLAKAFDSVAWPFLLEVLERIGFPLRWRNWISAILSSASTRVLVNGRQGRRICHARGLRQGNPLSPLLLIIVMEVLNILVAEADRLHILSPLPGNDIKHRASVYADDLIIFLRPEPEDFNCIRQILSLFAGTSRLETNLDKCVITPIRCSEEQIAAVQEAFPCVVAPFPCKYLGAPLSLTRLARSDEQRLVDSVASPIPTWKAGLINNAG